MGKRDRGAAPDRHLPAPARDRRGIVKRVPKVRKTKLQPRPKP